MSTNVVSSGRVQLTTVCTNPKCPSSSFGLRSIALLCQTRKGMPIGYVHEKKLSSDCIHVDT